MSPERRGLKRIRVALEDRSYPIVVGPGAMSEAGPALAKMGGGSGITVVTNAKVSGLYLDALLASVRRARLQTASVVELPDGERFKTLATVEKVYDAILDAGADRSMVVVALGGGVVGDVAGFAAATALRGMRLVMVPTTLLAQVDSSVGGKTGVNRSQGKNLVGAFHQPSLVLADTKALLSLSDREFRAGLAEVVKYGVILSRQLFTLLEKNTKQVSRRNPVLMADIVARSCRLKAKVVAADEREAGLRKVLNFGHTIGHAVEKLTAYERYLHGEAVAIGMVAAARISAAHGACEQDLPSRVAELLGALGLDTELPRDVSMEDLRGAIGFDKKSSGDKVDFVLTGGLGSHERRLLSPADVVASL